MNTVFWPQNLNYLKKNTANYTGLRNTCLEAKTSLEVLVTMKIIETPNLDDENLNKKSWLIWMIKIPYLKDNLWWRPSLLSWSLDCQGQLFTKIVDLVSENLFVLMVFVLLAGLDDCCFQDANRESFAFFKFLYPPKKI